MKKYTPDCPLEEHAHTYTLADLGIYTYGGGAERENARAVDAGRQPF